MEINAVGRQNRLPLTALCLCLLGARHVICTAESRPGSRGTLYKEPYPIGYHQMRPGPCTLVLALS
jgi:hypothetical protein